MLRRKSGDSCLTGMCILSGAWMTNRRQLERVYCFQAGKRRWTALVEMCCIAKLLALWTCVMTLWTYTHELFTKNTIRETFWNKHQRRARILRACPYNRRSGLRYTLSHPLHTYYRLWFSSSNVPLLLAIMFSYSLHWFVSSSSFSSSHLSFSTAVSRILHNTSYWWIASSQACL